MTENELLYALLDVCLRRTACPDCPSGAGQPCVTVIGYAPGTPVTYYHTGRRNNGIATFRAVEHTMSLQTCARCGEDIAYPIRQRPWHICTSDEVPIDAAVERGKDAEIEALRAEIAALKGKP